MAEFRITCPDGSVIEGVGEVEVWVADDPGDEVRSWLAHLDPAVIERAALDRQGWGTASLAAETIAVLLNLADARWPGKVTSG